MSLEDKFYPEDGSYITRFDNFMIKTTGKLGEAYQQTTGNNCKDLVKKCYNISTCGFGISALPLNVLGLALCFCSFIEGKNPQFMSPLTEEISNEVQGRYRKISKYERMIYAGLIPVSMLIGYVLLTHKPLNPESQQVLPSILMKGIGAGKLLTSISLVPHTFAEYLRRADIPKPPKKTVFQRVTEKISSSFKKPVPVRVE